MLYVDRYISVKTYEEYIRLLGYWRSRLVGYEIIYSVDTIDTLKIVTQECFNKDVLVAAWLHEEDKQLEIDIFDLSKVYMSEETRKSFNSIEIIDSENIK